MWGTGFSEAELIRKNKYLLERVEEQQKRIE